MRRVHAGAQRQHGIPMTDQKNTILAIVLSALVLIGWQYFFGMPQMEKQRQEQLQAQQQAQQQQPQAAGRKPASRQPGAAPAQPGRAAGARARPAPPRRRPAAHPRGRARGLAARRRSTTAEPAGLDRAQGRPHRRSRADQVSRDRRSEIAADRAAVAVRQRRIRSTPSSAGSAAAGADVKVPDRRYGVDAGRLRRARRRPAGDADLRQRRRA